MDRYSRVVFTVIALALTAIAFEGIPAAVAAQEMSLSYNDACGTATHPVCNVRVMN